MYFAHFDHAARAAFTAGQRRGMAWAHGVQCGPAQDAQALLAQIGALSPSFAPSADGLPGDVVERGLLEFATFLRAELGIEEKTEGSHVPAP